MSRNIVLNSLILIPESEDNRITIGEAIIQTGGHTYWCCREASGADEMRRAVREQVRGGADLIKIMACHDTLEFTDAELEAVIDEAHRNGLPITAHATYDAAIRRVAEAGIDCVEHGGSMSEATIQVLVDRNIPIVTTFAPLVMQSQADLARQYNIPEWKIAERQRAVAEPSRYQGLIDAARAGVTIAFGTDAGSPVVGHDVIAPEMAFMVKVGVKADNYDAIRSATAVAARINSLEDKWVFCNMHVGSVGICYSYDSCVFFVPGPCKLKKCTYGYYIRII